MSILDRLRRMEMDNGTDPQEASSRLKTSSSTTLVPAEPPVIQRLRGIFGELQNVMKQSSAGESLDRFSFLINSVTAEIVEELAALDVATLEMYLYQIGLMFEWVGSGDLSLLPEHLRPFAEKTMAPVRIELESSECL